MMIIKKYLLFILIICFVASQTHAQTNIRTSISLDYNWKTVAADSLDNSLVGFEKPSFNDKNWKQVNVPHNWDAYEGYRRMRHGNRHGYAWYRKTFTIARKLAGKRYFLFFEGVGSYGTVWLNNKKVGYHSGGRTTFTIDVTNEILSNGKTNVLAVLAAHPAFIKDQPWVCGGCSDERGFSEGSQPMGIFRPVQLLITDEIRIEPFGVHIWNDANISKKDAVLNIENTIKNYGSSTKSITVVNKLVDKNGTVISSLKSVEKINAGQTINYKGKTPEIRNPQLWSLENPYLYTIVTEVLDGNKMIDRITTPYGIRWISWPVGKATSSNQFFLNGKPVFINGIAEYEHLIGNSHAFSADQIRTRAMQVKATGFNAFRDGHQPHNLRYQNYWDSLGILWWTQLSAHVWYDTPEFRSNFKALLKEWVIERRNSPSVVLWGLQNESKLPADFAKECTELIRSLDPTASSQRLVTTCNGGEGTDWDVPQNWTGTYGGNPDTYSDDVKRQVLIGEYGAWRTLDLHTEGGFVQNGSYSEDRMTQLMEMKVRLAEAAKDSAAGHFFWLLTSHDNPGRVQGGEGLRELDRIGPVNYKGLMTPWEEPLDVFYMFRSNYAPKDKEPMVYIASHTWPDRWLTTGEKDSIFVYSNCDEVELFNDVNSASLGKQKRNGIGTHFQWDNVPINYNFLYAVGYVDGKAVAKDYIVLNHLPKAPNFVKLYQDVKPVTAAATGYNYLYRVNCGGPDYKDQSGNTWMADRQLNADSQKHETPSFKPLWGSTSWGDDFKGMPSFFASQRQTYDPIAGTKDWPLFQSFRFGRDRLKYHFPVPDGEYLVELYFTEPWLGTGGGMDCTGWRKFDVAVNGKTIIKDLDIWKEVGHDKALKKTAVCRIAGGKLELSFPSVASGQAVISAIAIASKKTGIQPAQPASLLIKDLVIANGIDAKLWSVKTWMNTGDQLYSNDSISFSSLPSQLYGAEWLQTPKNTSSKSNEKLAAFVVSDTCDVFVALDAAVKEKPDWLKEYEDTKSLLETDENGGHTFVVYRKRFNAGNIVSLESDSSATMYIVAVTKANSIEPAYDLKTVSTYKAIEARLSGAGVVKETINGKENVAIKRAAGDTIEWKFSVGVADTYSLTIKYASLKERELKGKLQLLSIDGTLMREEQVNFTTSKPGKWNYINSSTGSMINAGTYLVRLISIDAEGLGLSSLDVQ
jgi:beta-galactosidase